MENHKKKNAQDELKSDSKSKNIENNPSNEGYEQTKNKFGRIFSQMGSFHHTVEVVTSLLIIFIIIMSVIYLGYKFLGISRLTNEESLNKKSEVSEVKVLNANRLPLGVEDKVKSQIIKQVNSIILDNFTKKIKSGDKIKSIDKPVFEIEHIVFSENKDKILLFCHFVEKGGIISKPFKIILELSNEFKIYSGNIAKEIDYIGGSELNYIQK